MEGVRNLGIPTVLDRLIQQAVMQVLQRQWDGTFSEHSYGFRPGRSAHQAVARAQQYIAEGHGWCIDLDLEKFFDRVNHDQLMGRIAKRVGDKRLLEAHSGILERRGDGKWVGQSERRGHSARRATFAPAQQSRARRTRSGVRAPGTSLCSIRGRLQYLCSQRAGGSTGDGERFAIHHARAQTQGE